MGLQYGVAIVTATDVASITHESSLTNIDGSGGDTLANSMSEATNELIRRIRSRSFDPALVDSDTITELKAAAAYCTCYLIFAAQNQADEENRAKTEGYKKRFEEQLSIVVIRTSNQDARVANPHGAPVVMNVNSTWVIGGRDTQVPNGVADKTWLTKLEGNNAPVNE